MSDTAELDIHMVGAQLSANISAAGSARFIIISIPKVAVVS